MRGMFNRGLTTRFVHEQIALRRVVEQDSFENLPKAVVVPSNDELVFMPFACSTVGAGDAGGAGGAGGAGCSGGAGGSGG